MAVEIRRLIDGMAAANPLWRAPRIHGEWKMLRLEVSERTVSRLDHFVILNARHLKRTLSPYFAYHHGSSTHLGLDKQCPHARSRVSEGSSRFRTSAACITDMNELPRNGVPADALLANDRVTSIE
jgi:hypothetical protein